MNADDFRDAPSTARQTWARHIDFMDVETLVKPTLDPFIFTNSFNELIKLCLLHSQRVLAASKFNGTHMQKFQSWIDSQLLAADLIFLTTIDNGTLGTRVDQIVVELKDTPIGIVALAMRAISNKMEAIFSGDVHLLDVLHEDNLLERLYSFMDTTFDKSLFLQHIAHSKPNLRILEIGLGRGSATKSILHHLTPANGHQCYSQYTYTETSSALLNTIKERFKNTPNMNFATLDITHDPDEQGFKDQRYDLIIATNALHMTPNLCRSLTHIRKLLSENGRLLLHELCPTSKWANYLFGAMPSWWAGVSDDRPDEPYVTPSRWNTELTSAGFKELDGVVFDAEDPLQLSAVMVAKPNIDYATAGKVTLLCDRKQPEPASLIQQLQKRGLVVSKCHLGERLPSGQDVIAVLDITEPYLETVDDISWMQLKILVGSLGNSMMLWVTKLCQLHCHDPRYAQVIGLARTLRSETSAHFGTCETDDVESTSELIADVFTKFRFQPTSDHLAPDFEYEYAIFDNAVHVGRFYPFHLNEDLSTSEPNDHFALEFVRAGRIDSLCWSPRPPEILKDDEVEVETYAVGLNLRVRTELLPLLSQILTAK
jgi:SAM-dependent methyltransferase